MRSSREKTSLLLKEVKRMTYVLGIDGGGTKTEGVIANREGKTVAVATVGASNPNIVSHASLLKEFSILVERLKVENKEAVGLVGRVFAGISGAGQTSAKKKIVDVLTIILPTVSSIIVDNDAIIALYSGTRGKPGIVQISGTGSITYGINAQGKRARVGGWGHYIDERGSGYGLGHDALKATFLAYDKMDVPTELTELLLEYFEESSLNNILSHIYQAENPKEIIASLGRLVMEAAENGDGVANEIIDQHGLYIGKCIVTLTRQLFFDIDRHDDKAMVRNAQEKETIPIVLAGGLFNRLELFRNAIERELKNQPRSVTLIRPEASPVHGAVIAALT